jgi:uncharacterized membrane protein YjjP (DUF1212 family)
MPKSKGRKKANRRPTPPKKRQEVAKKQPPSPTWYVVLMWGLMAVGILVILINYMGLLPGGTSNAYLIAGLLGIAVGFAMTLNYR